MSTRILKVTPIIDAPAFYVPQQQINGKWQEFVGFDRNWTYPRLRTFDNLFDAKVFVDNPAIFTPGSNEDDVEIVA